MHQHYEAWILHATTYVLQVCARKYGVSGEAFLRWTGRS